MHPRAHHVFQPRLEALLDGAAGRCYTGTLAKDGLICLLGSRILGAHPSGGVVVAIEACPWCEPGWVPQCLRPRRKETAINVQRKVRNEVSATAP